VKRGREDPLEPPKRSEEEDDQSIPEWMIDRVTVRPDDRLVQDEQIEMYQQLLTDMPEDKRETFRMVYDAELEMKEVAARLGVPVGTIKSRVHSARKTLAAGLRNQFLDTEE
jgi:RNA polymerase sigma factor (sigma-70 family)